MWTRIAGLALASLFVAGCSATNDGYTYVKNSKENLFFKLPDAWGRFPVKAEAVVDRPKPMKGMSTRWAVEFDGSKKPTKAHVSELFTDSPVGYGEAYALSTTGQDQINEKTMRSLVISELVTEMTDPFDLIDQAPDRIEVVDYKRIRNRSGVWGHKIIVNVKIDPDQSGNLRWLTIGQKVYLDRNAQTLRRLVVRCSASCYRNNRSSMDAVLNSFSFRP